MSGQYIQLISLIYILGNKPIIENNLILHAVYTTHSYQRRLQVFLLFPRHGFVWGGLQESACPFVRPSVRHTFCVSVHFRTNCAQDCSQTWWYIDWLLRLNEHLVMLCWIPVLLNGRVVAGKSPINRSGTRSKTCWIDPLWYCPVAPFTNMV